MVAPKNVKRVVWEVTSISDEHASNDVVYLVLCWPSCSSSQLHSTHNLFYRYWIRVKHERLVTKWRSGITIQATEKERERGRKRKREHSKHCSHALGRSPPIIAQQSNEWADYVAIGYRRTPLWRQCGQACETVRADVTDTADTHHGMKHTSVSRSYLLQTYISRYIYKLA